MRFADAEIDARKKLFGDHLLAYVPLAARIKMVLDERPNHTRPRRRASSRNSRIICRKSTPSGRLKSVINWGRYGEVFAYDETSETLSLENPQ